ncbi:MAG: hypothetical protein IJA35_07710 [Clostridia bacterium]|nr:hypothetical protein [Clostridia bacterium]
MNFFEQMLQMNGENEQAVNQLSDAMSEYEGKSEDELTAELKRLRESGQISDYELEQFVATVAPFLDNGQQIRLYQLIESLK